MAYCNRSIGSRRWKRPDHCNDRKPISTRLDKGSTLAGTLDCKQPAVGRPGLGLELREIGQATQAAEVGGRGADQLGAQGPALLQVLLDPRVPVVEVDADLGIFGDDSGGEGADGVLAH